MFVIISSSSVVDFFNSATAIDHRDNLGDTTCTETESVVSSRRGV